MLRFVFLFMVLGASCKQPNSRKNTFAGTTAKTSIKDTIPYALMKQTVLHQKKLFQQSSASFTKQEKSAQLKHVFIALLADSIIPYWYGTPWDFNGITETPGKGSIACGYFITTTLRDIGYKLNRYKVAQMASTGIIQSLVQPKHIVNYSSLGFEQFIQKLTQRGKAVYVIGLDNHVGYLYHDGNALYFIHSTFVGKRCVMKEIAGESPVLAASRFRIVGNISEDNLFLEQWLAGS